MEPQLPETDYLLIGIDSKTRFVWRFLSLNNTLQHLLKVHQPPSTLHSSFCQFVLGAALLGSRHDEQQTTLFKLKLAETEIRFNCEVSPAGPLRAALFPKDMLGEFHGLFAGELSEHILQKNNQMYQSVMKIHSDGMLASWRHFLQQSKQSQSHLSLYENNGHFYGLWIEKLPETSPSDWADFASTFGERRLDHAIEASQDPDIIIQNLFGTEFKILKVEKPFFQCNCGKERILLGLASLPTADLVELFVDGKGIESRCDYCHKIHLISDEEVKEVIKSGGIH